MSDTTWQPTGRLARLTLGQLPSRMRRQIAQARKYRRELEQVVLDTKGQISPYDAHLIDQAATAEVHAAVCRWLLRERIDDMTNKEILDVSKSMLWAKGVRNAAVKELGIDQRVDVFEALYDDKQSETPT